DNNNGNAFVHHVDDAIEHPFAVLRGEDQSLDARSRLQIDEVDLFASLALFLWPVPIDGLGYPFGAVVRAGTLGTPVDRLPELVRQPLGNDGDSILDIGVGPAATAEHTGGDGQGQISLSRHRTSPSSRRVSVRDDGVS